MKVSQESLKNTVELASIRILKSVIFLAETLITNCPSSFPFIIYSFSRYFFEDLTLCETAC